MRGKSIKVTHPVPSRAHSTGLRLRSKVGTTPPSKVHPDEKKEASKQLARQPISHGNDFGVCPTPRSCHRSAKSSIYALFTIKIYGIVRITTMHSPILLTKFNYEYIEGAPF